MPEKMKSARERAEQAILLLGGSRDDPTFNDKVTLLANSFKEHARDQRQVCADEIAGAAGLPHHDQELLIDRWRRLTSAHLHQAVKNTPRPRSVRVSATCSPGCTCVGVELGTYANAVSLYPPPGLGITRIPVTVDRCIALEVVDLWNLGICTLNSCCGHGKVPPMLIVAKRDEERMRELGYAVLPMDGPTTFIPKSVSVPLVQSSECA